MTACTCPNCAATLNFTMKEMLSPYSMQMVVRPDEGRAVSAETVAKVLLSLSKALKEAGKIVDHDTEVFLTGAEVDPDGSIMLTVAATPIVRKTAA